MYGDVHKAQRVALGVFPYTHFGVELPDGTIVENSPPGVRSVPFADFSRGAPTYVSNPDAGPAERAETVRRAASRIGERRYSLSGNNCEHFATWCATGVAIRYQGIECFQALFKTVRAATSLFLTVSLLAE